MKRFTATVTFALLAALLVGDGLAGPKKQKDKDKPKDDPSDTVWYNPPRKPMEGVEHHKFESDVLERTVGYSIILPKAYEKFPQGRFPVVYFLHKAYGNESSSYSYAKAYLKAMEEGEVEPMIIVFPAGGSSTFFNDDEKLAVETYLLKELIPHIDKEYRTVADRYGRAIEGEGMGASAAMKFILKHPSVFSSAVCYGGRFLSRGGKLNSPASLALARRGKIAGNVRIRMIIGDEKDAGRYGLKFSKLLDRLKIPHEAVPLGRARGLHHYVRKTGEDNWAFHMESFRKFCPTTLPATSPATTTAPATQPAEKKKEIEIPPEIYLD